MVEVEYTCEFEEWWNDLSEDEQVSVAGAVGLLEERGASLLIAGDKTGDDRFYERMTPIADRLYDEHLRELENGD